MSEKKVVECAEHGGCEEAFVCRHLLEGESQGFHMAEDPDSLLWPDAWCDQCDEALSVEGEWNDASMAFADIKLICSACYERVRERNWREDKEAFSFLIADAVAVLNRKQARMRERYPIDDCERYDWDQDVGQLVFSHEGKARVIAGIAFVGGISTMTNTWMWSWANDSVSERVKAEMLSVRAFGVENNFLRLASAYWSADEHDGWEMAAIATKILGAEGAYRTPRDHGFTYMVIKDLHRVE